MIVMQIITHKQTSIYKILPPHQKDGEHNLLQNETAINGER